MLSKQRKRLFRVLVQNRIHSRIQCNWDDFRVRECLAKRRMGATKVSRSQPQQNALDTALDGLYVTSVWLKGQVADNKWVTDEQAAQSILINLVDNAIKFTNHGLVRVNVSISGEHDNLDIVVSHTGI